MSRRTWCSCRSATPKPRRTCSPTRRSILSARFLNSSSAQSKPNAPRSATRPNSREELFVQHGACFVSHGRSTMARKYSKKASAKVGRAMKKRKAGTLRSGRSGKKVKSRKQAIAIGLSEARAEGKKVPKKAAKKRKTAKKRKAKK